MRDQQTNTTESQSECSNTACGSELSNSITLKSKQGEKKIMNTNIQPATRLQAAEALHQLQGFIGTAQRQVIGELCYSEEKQFFYGKFVALAEVVSSMPVTYGTDGQGDQAVVYLHYFTGSCDWYITERDVEAEQLQAFGMANLGYGGELGYISIVELLQCGAELDLYWTPKKLAEI